MESIINTNTRPSRGQCTRVLVISQDYTQIWLMVLFVVTLAMNANIKQRIIKKKNDMSMCDLIKCCWWLDSVIYYKPAKLGFQGCKLTRFIGMTLTMSRWLIKLFDMRFIYLDASLWQDRSMTLCIWKNYKSLRGMTPIRLQSTLNSFINNIGYDEKLCLWWKTNQSTTFLTQPNIKQAQHKTKKDS